MLDDPAAWVAWLSALPLGLLLLVLFLGAFIEYVFPPFPGDLVVVLGAVAVGAGDRALLPVAVAVTLGALLGTAVDWWLGVRAAAHLDRLGPRRRRAVDRLVEGFRRVGPVLLVANRFAPGIRALFFVAAGVAGLGLGPVLLWSSVSAAAWNALLLGLGLQVGWNLDAVLASMRAMGWMGGGVVVALVALWAAASWSLRGRDA